MADYTDYASRLIINQNPAQPLLSMTVPQAYGSTLTFVPSGGQVENNLFIFRNGEWVGVASVAVP